MKSLKKAQNSQFKKELSIEEKINYIQYIADNYQNDKSLYKAMAINAMKLIFIKGFVGKALDGNTIEEINKVYIVLKDLTICNIYNFPSDSTIQKKPKSIELCFKNGNLILPFKIALIAKYSFKDIVDILNISYEEVCKQFNQMAKESGYKLFN